MKYMFCYRLQANWQAMPAPMHQIQLRNSSSFMFHTTSYNFTQFRDTLSSTPHKSPIDRAAALPSRFTHPLRPTRPWPHNRG